MRRHKLIAAILVVAVVASVSTAITLRITQDAPVSPLSAPAATPTNMLKNPDFEEGFHFQSDIGELYIGNWWKAYWFEVECDSSIFNCYNLECIPYDPGCYIQCPMNCDYGWHCDPEHIDWGCWWARPEFRDTDNPSRVQHGIVSQKYFTHGRMHQAGLYQEVSGVTPGVSLRFSIWVQTWQCRNYTDCCPYVKCHSDFPYAMHLQVGIDPYGGTDPTSPDIVWSSERESFDVWTQLSVVATPVSNTVTVFFQSRADFDYARINNDVYIDNGKLEEVHLVMLPAIFGGSGIPENGERHADLTKSAILAIPNSITMTVGETRTVYLIAENLIDDDAAYLSAIMTFTQSIVSIDSVELGDYLGYPFPPNVSAYLGYPENVGTAEDGILTIEMLGMQTGEKLVATLVLRGVSPGIASIAPRDRSWCYIGLWAESAEDAGGGAINPAICDSIMVTVE
jgi:hypothetical protein